MILLFLNLTNLISEIEQPFHVSLDICFLLRPKKPLHSAFLNFAKIFTSASYRPFQILSVMCFTMVPKIHIVQERPKKNHELCQMELCTYLYFWRRDYSSESWIFIEKWKYPLFVFSSSKLRRQLRQLAVLLFLNKVLKLARTWLGVGNFINQSGALLH